jgi:hypothetical protein
MIVMAKPKRALKRTMGLGWLMRLWSTTLLGPAALRCAMWG